MTNMVLPCNQDFSWFIGSLSYYSLYFLLFPCVRSRDFRKDPIKHSRLHSNFESLTLGLQGRNSSHCTMQMLFLPYSPIFHNTTWFYLVAQKILGLQVRPLTITHSNSSVFALQKQGDFRRGPIKRSKLHPKDKVKSTIQSPQLFGPQNGAQQNQQAAAGFICS